MLTTDPAASSPLVVHPDFAPGTDRQVRFFSVYNPLNPGETELGQLTEKLEAMEQADVLDRILLGYSSVWAHNQVTAPYLLALSPKMSVIVAHRPGVMHPAAAARYFATLDGLSGGGRLAVNLVVGGNDQDLAREGDHTPKTERYARATEYLDVMRATWSTHEAFDHQGEYFTAEKVRPWNRPVHRHIPIFMGGDSDAAVEFGAQHADLYMLFGEPLAGTKERIDRVRATAAKYDREPQFSISLRLFVGDTDEHAWEQARAVERTILEAQDSGMVMRPADTDKSVGYQRQKATLDDEIHDDCYWTGLSRLLGGFANSQALVGTEERVLAALAEYRKLGVGTFLATGGVMGGWEPSLAPFLERAKREL